jgi:hypothetical protein
MQELGRSIVELLRVSAAAREEKSCAEHRVAFFASGARYTKCGEKKMFLTPAVIRRQWRAADVFDV